MLEHKAHPENFEEVTVEEVYKALALNGFEHLRSQWTAHDVRGAIKGACILGQGALNLGVVMVDENDSDEDPYSLLNQLNKLSVPPTSQWDVDYGAGSTIIEWNDKTEFILKKDGSPARDRNGNMRKQYVLRTYKDVLKMAHDVLSPHFSKKLILRKKEYNLKRKPGATGFIIEGVTA
jgi:hypothetical protein